MKKEIVAAVIVLLLTAGAIVNTLWLKSFTEELSETISSSRQSCEDGDFAEAERFLREAIGAWNESESYTHIFIRHSEVDSATDAFYELLSLVCAKDAESAVGAYEKLLSHLDSIYTMERVSLGSIF